MKVKLVFIEPLLGTLSGNPETATEFILGRNPVGGNAADEVEALPPSDALEKSSTIFARQDGKPFLWDYQAKGFMKDACGMMRRVPDSVSGKLKSYKKVIDGLIFVKPRKIIINVAGEITFCERPLRAQTAQGERIALARSEQIQIGSSIEFEVVLLDPKLAEYVEEWLTYGRLRGLGQWRNSGMGSFEWEKLQ